jgi:Tfp pilus assembly protein PilF
MQHRQSLIFGLIVFVAAFALFAPSLGFEFLDVDDGNYVFENPHVQDGLTLEGIRWAFGGFHGSTWVPTTFLSLMLDRSLFGPEPGGFHFTNVLLHALNALLFYLLIARTTRRPFVALVTALLFALHPMRIEAVAWITSRKDVLSTFFWLATMHLWVEYVRTGRRWPILTAVGTFAVGIGAKQMLVTLPLVLILFDRWPLKRPWSARLVYEKIPFLLVALLGAGLAWQSQSSGGAVTTTDVLGLGDRVGNAIVGYATYLFRLLYPVDLVYLYPHPSLVPPYEGWSWPAIVGSLGAILAMSGAVVILARRGVRSVTVGWWWYLVTLLPVIGLVQFGLHANANRFSYVPHLGLMLGFTFLAARVVDRRTSWRRPAAAVALLLIVASAWQTTRELPHWQNSERLFRHAIEVDDRNGMAMTALGAHLARSGRKDEALVWLDRAVRVQPRLAPAHANLGIVLAGIEGRADRAVDHLRRALNANPANARARVALGNVQARQGNLKAAARQYRSAIEQDPSRWNAHFGLGRIADARDNEDAAREHFRRALRWAPDQPSRELVRQALSQLEGD